MLAGQPQEPWQSYSPQPASTHDPYGYQQSGAQGAQGGQGARGADQTIHDMSIPAVQDQEAPPWQEAPSHPGHPARRRGNGEAKGFIGALFDFSFTDFVTPKIIKALYLVFTIWTIVWALIFLRFGFKYGGMSGGIFTLIIVDPILLLVSLGAFRVVLELFMVIHRIHDDVRAIRERGGERI